MDLPGLFSWPCPGLGRVLLISAWPARAQLPHSAGQSGSACGGASPPSRTFSLAVAATATWCSGGPPAARWAVSGPSCTAAWKARCCGPGNSPSGRHGTVTGRKAQASVTRRLKSDPSSLKPPFCRHRPTFPSASYLVAVFFRMVASKRKLL